MSIELKGVLLGLVAALGVLGVAFGLSALLQRQRTGDSNPLQQSNVASVQPTAVLSEEARRGYGLFDRNCAQCHGDDARGDEGPNLHGLAKGDSRIASLIKRGVKGEMPAFAKKFNDADVQSLIAYLRTLKE